MTGTSSTLREIEMHGDAISKSLIEERLAKKKIAHDIYNMKHVLIDYLNVLWATKDVVDSLRYGDADLITNDEKLLGRIGILSDNIDRHIEPLGADVQCAFIRARSDAEHL